MAEETQTAAQVTTEAATGSGKVEQTSQTASAETTSQPTETAAAPQETQTQTEALPEKYEFQIPKDSKLSADAIKDVEAYAKENKLTQSQAQQILDRESKSVAAFELQQQSELAAKASAWVDQIKADKEMGGERFAENIEHGKRVIEKFGTPELRAALEQSGLGNHPEVVRTFVRIGKAMAEDKIVFPGHATATTKSNPAEILYGAKRK